MYYEVNVKCTVNVSERFYAVQGANNKWRFLCFFKFFLKFLTNSSNYILTFDTQNQYFEIFNKVLYVNLLPILIEF